MKVVINASIGGFCVSRAVYDRLGPPWNEWLDRLPEECSDEERAEWPILLYVSDPALRSDPALVAAVEELGAAASREHTTLKVVEIPDGIKWHVCEGEDGREWIAEDHRTWS